MVSAECYFVHLLCSLISILWCRHGDLAKMVKAKQYHEAIVNSPKSSFISKMMSRMEIYSFNKDISEIDSQIRELESEIKASMAKQESKINR